MERHCELANKTTHDILFNKLAQSITKWTKACDKRLNRMISHVHHTCGYRQCCHVGNTAKQCRLGLFQDSDFAEDLEDSKYTSGGTLCMFGSHTFVPIGWMCKKQTAVLKTARQSPTVVMATPPHEQQSATLLNLLTMLTQKGARTVTRKAGNNYFEANRQMCLMNGTSDQQGSTGLFLQIMTLKFGSKIEEDRLNEFLELVRRHDEANGTDPVPDQVKKACIISTRLSFFKTTSARLRRNDNTVESMDTKHLIVGSSRRTNLKVKAMGTGKSKSKKTEISESDNSKHVDDWNPSSHTSAQQPNFSQVSNLTESGKTEEHKLMIDSGCFGTCLPTVVCTANFQW